MKKQTTKRQPKDLTAKTASRVKGGVHDRVEDLGKGIVRGGGACSAGPQKQLLDIGDTACRMCSSHFASARPRRGRTILWA